jgi:hypothetical protein
LGFGSPSDRQPGETIAALIQRHERDNPERVARYRSYWNFLGKQENSARFLKPLNEWLVQGTHDDKYGAYGHARDG